MRNKGLFYKKNGVSLVEIIIATAILALIAVPLLNLFAASTRNTVISGNITAGSFICQKEMERLIKLDYFSLLNDSVQFYDSNNALISKSATTYGYPQISYTVRIKPSGVHNDLLIGTTQTPQYNHMVFYNVLGTTTNALYAFFPDGTFVHFSPLGATVTYTYLSTSNGVTQNRVVAGSPLATKSFTSNSGKRMITINNITRISNLMTASSIRYISYPSTPPSIPYTVFYAKDQASIDKFTMIPTPVSGKILNYVGGDLYDKMLVDVEIIAYFTQGTSKIEVAKITDTISPRIVIS